MRKLILSVTLQLVLGSLLAPARAGEVAIYTGNTVWIDKASADTQARICVDKLNAAGIASAWFASDTDQAALADWVVARTNDGQLDVLVLFGYFPETIYPAGNVLPDGSIAEIFIESTDGDTILNHGDYMFYVSMPFFNQVEGLQNMMDVPGITMWDDDTPMIVTDDGRVIAPSLNDFMSDRPFHVDELAGDWWVEATLAQNAAGTRADPVVVRDGNRGRLVPALQAVDQDDPKGAVGAEIIIWLMANAGGPGPVFRRGDSNGDGVLHVSDAVYVFRFLFNGGPPLSCREAGDASGDGDVDMVDGVHILEYLFGDGPAPPAPGPHDCGEDTDEPGTAGDLGCESYTAC
jgi:hypothetical protein